MKATAQTITVPQWRSSRLAYILLALSWLAYALMTLFAPTNNANPYHLSHAQTWLLDLTIAIPIGVIWYISLNGALSFKRYAGLVQEAPEYPGLNTIANGLLWLVAYLIILGLSGAVLPYLASSGWLHAAVIARDHLQPLISLVAFAYLYRGSQHLTGIVGVSTWTRGTALMAAGFGVFAVVFVLAFVGSGAPAANSRSSLALVPHTVLLYTLILPYLISWFLGVLAGTNILKYATHAKGTIYRRALHHLVRGILGVVGFAIILQLISFATRFFTSLPLSNILVILYGIIILYALGFLFIRAGAKMLSRIEVVK